MMRSLSSSAMDGVPRPFFSGSRLGECLRLQKTKENIIMIMMKERATDKARTTTALWDVVFVLGLFQPVGKLDRSKSSSGGEDSGPGGLLMSFCNVAGSDEGGGHGFWNEKSGGKDVAVMEMVQT